MSAFEFRLGRVLDVRRVEEQAQARLHEAARVAVAEQERRIEGLAAERVRAQQVRREITTAGVDVSGLAMAQSWINRLARELEEARSELRRRLERAAELLKCRVEAAREVRVLERLQDRRRLEELLAEGRAEQKRLDETALRRGRTA